MASSDETLNTFNWITRIVTKSGKDRIRYLDCSYEYY